VTYQDGGATRIRRIVAVDAEWPRLTIDAGGLIQPGALGSTRLSDPKKAARNYGPIPEAHQLHHIVPDEVVKKHPLFEQARTRGTPPYDLDYKPNLIALPESRIAQIKAESTGLPLHNGSHPDYSSLVGEICERVARRLAGLYGSLERVPAEHLTKAAQGAEALARDLLGSWITTRGEKLK
jgi:hypothetical protein